MRFDKILLLGGVFVVGSAFVTDASAARAKKDSFFVGAQVRYSNLLFSGSGAIAGDNNGQNEYLRLNNKRRPTSTKFALQVGFDSFTDRNIYTALLADVNIGGPSKVDYSTKGSGSGDITANYDKAKLSNTFAIGGEGRLGYRFAGSFSPFLLMGVSLNTIKIYDNTDSTKDVTERTKSYNKLGYAAGVGALYSINDRVSLEASYKYTKILNLKHEFKGVVTAGNTAIGTQKLLFDQHYISAGVNIHF